MLAFDRLPVEEYVDLAGRGVRSSSVHQETMAISADVVAEEKETDSPGLVSIKKTLWRR